MKELRNITINKRLKIAYFIVSVLPMLAMSLSIYYQSLIYIGEINLKYLNQTQLYTQEIMTQQYKDFNSGIVQIIYQSRFQEYYKDFLDHKMESIYFKYLLESDIRKLFIETNKSIDAVAIQPKLTQSRINLYIDEDLYGELLTLDKGVYEQAEQLNGRFFYHYQSINGRKMLVATRKIYAMYSKKTIDAGYMSIFLNDHFFDVIHNIDFDGNIKIFVDDYAMYSKNDKPFHKEQSFFVKQHMDDYNMELCTFIDKKEMNKEKIHLSILLFMVALILFGFSYIFNYIFSNSIINPLKLLSLASQKVAGGDFEIKIKEDGKDEITAVVKSFNTMVVKLKSLIFKNYESKLKEKDYKLKLLQMQINPHFLYNTLDTIRFRAIKANQDILSKDITLLSKMFKNMLNEESVITLEQEISYIKDYMYFQQNNYKDLLLVTFDIEKEVEPCLCVKSIIQPVVENSILHGMDETKSILNISIQAKKIAEYRVDIIIEDDGRGTDQNLMLEDHLKQYPKHIGLKNIHDRIREFYGEDYGIEFYSEKGKGTVVTLKIDNIIG